MNFTDNEGVLKRRAAISDEDNEPKDDYLEAEIESTDSLRIAVNELFGVRLLETKFRVWNTNSKSVAISALGRDEIAAPPGTVPRCAPQEHIVRKRVPTSKTMKSTAATQNGEQSLTLTNRLTSLSADSLLSGVLPDRPTSISSQQTFILENDRRKPLVARNAFQLVTEFQQPSSSQVPLAKNKVYGKDNGCRTTATPANRAVAILSRGISEPRLLKQFTTEDSSLPRKTDANSRTTSKSHTSVNDDDGLLIPSFKKKISDCIPYNTDTDQYVIAFGSRPKVPRTPTEKHDKRKPGEYCHSSRSVIDSY
ncbi:unnamed protein product [Anisakis simplex]|uniref:Uncharacterized protein n=1 Tax=Anisakis simplex TaxID=6269 RepID=A0A0M3JWR2_ANISI|nr:unnamed protein product [Anisakis simplex]